MTCPEPELIPVGNMGTTDPDLQYSNAKLLNATVTYGPRRAREKRKSRLPSFKKAAASKAGASPIADSFAYNASPATIDVQVTTERLGRAVSRTHTRPIVAIDDNAMTAASLFAEAQVKRS